MVFFSRPSLPLPTLPSLGIHHLFTPFSFLFQRGLEAVTLPQSLIPCRYHLPLSNHRSLALPLIKPTWKCGMLVYQGHIFILTSLGICKVVVFFPGKLFFILEFYSNFGQKQQCSEHQCCRRYFGGILNAG